MAGPLSFRFNLDKFVNALAYFVAKGVADLTILKAAKLLYLADRNHFLRHGRPITGDRYIAMDLGPVPEGAYQLISRVVAGDEIDDAPKAKVLEVLAVYRGIWGTLQYPTLRLKRKHQPDLDVFSDSEIEALDATISEFGARPARDLVDLTHEHKAYQLADAERSPGSSVALPYELFFADVDTPAVRDLVEHQQEDRDFVEALRKAGRSAVSSRPHNTATAH
jgi:uncharacterized phage-associated protein